MDKMGDQEVTKEAEALEVADLEEEEEEEYTYKLGQIMQAAAKEGIPSRVQWFGFSNPMVEDAYFAWTAKDKIIGIMLTTIVFCSFAIMYQIMCLDSKHMMGDIRCRTDHGVSAGNVAHTAGLTVCITCWWYSRHYGYTFALNHLKALSVAVFLLPCLTHIGVFLNTYQNLPPDATAQEFSYILARLVVRPILTKITLDPPWYLYVLLMSLQLMAFSVAPKTQAFFTLDSFFNNAAAMIVCYVTCLLFLEYCRRSSFLTALKQTHRAARCIQEADLQHKQPARRASLP